MPSIPEGYLFDAESSAAILASQDRYELKRLLVKWSKESFRDKMRPDPAFATSPICVLDTDYYDFSVDTIINDLKEQVTHIHIADAIGVDGEGLAIGDGDSENVELIKKMLSYNCLKVIEVWQGHLDNGAGFRKEIIKLTEMYENQ